MSRLHILSTALGQARSLPAQWPRDSQQAMRCMSWRASSLIYCCGMYMCGVLLFRKVGFVHAAQHLTIGAFKQTCKILLPVAFRDSILVPDLRMSLGERWI